MPTKTQERLAILETKVDYITEQVEDIAHNHLVTINKRLRAIEDSQRWKPKDIIALLSAAGALIITLLPHIKSLLG